MCNCQIYALRAELVGFLGAKISSMPLVPSLPANTARHVITFGTRQVEFRNFKLGQPWLIRGLIMHYPNRFVFSKIALQLQSSKIL